MPSNNMPNTLKLTEAQKQYLASLSRDQQDSQRALAAAQQAAARANQVFSGFLSYCVAEARLPGNYVLSPNGDELIEQQEAE